MSPPTSPEEVKAYIDNQISQTSGALRAEQAVGQSQIKEVTEAIGVRVDQQDAWINVTESELRGLKTQLRNLALRVDSSENRATQGGTNTKRENVTAKRETKALGKFGDRMGPSYIDWCFDVYTAMEQCCEEVNLITAWG